MRKKAFPQRVFPKTKRGQPVTTDNTLASIYDCGDKEWNENNNKSTRYEYSAEYRNDGCAHIAAFYRYKADCSLKSSRAA